MYTFEYLGGRIRRGELRGSQGRTHLILLTDEAVGLGELSRDEQTELLAVWERLETRLAEGSPEPRSPELLKKTEEASPRLFHGIV